MSKRPVRHGQAAGKQSPEYKTWASMIQRCTNPNSKVWDRYGGRGIRVCARWRHSFLAFLRDLGQRPSHRHSIGRINNDGHYEPGNVRWETATQQANNKRDNTNVTWQGKTMTLTQWARLLKIPRATLSARLNKLGWTVDRAFQTPINEDSSKGGRAKKPSRRQGMGQ